MIWRGAWDGSWDGSWEGAAEALPEGFMRATATIRISGTATLTDGNSEVTIPGWMTATATISLSASGHLTDASAPPVVEVTPPAPGSYGAVGQRTNVYVWRGPDLSRKMTDRRDPPSRDQSDMDDLLDIVQIFDELRLAA